MRQTTGSIDKAAIERLDLILSLANRVTGQSLDGTCHREAEWLCFAESTRPSFFWLIRDHHLMMRRSPKDEMLDKLDPAARDKLVQLFGSEFNWCYPH